MIVAAGDTGHGHIAILLIEVGGILFALGILGRLARRLRLPVIPLYLLAGLAFGQGGVVHLSASEDFISVAANIGVIMLLVMLGLEYSASARTARLRVQAPIGLLDGLLNAVPGAVVALVAGWGAVAAVALAGITWVSSSGVIAKNLSDSGRLGNRETPTILGVLVIEDLAMAIYLPLLTALLASRGPFSVVVAVTVAVATISVVLIAATR